MRLHEPVQTGPDQIRSDVTLSMERSSRFPICWIHTASFGGLALGLVLLVAGLAACGDGSKAARGDVETALDLIERSYEAGFQPGRGYATMDPLLNAIRDHPRFQAVMLNSLADPGGDAATDRGGGERGGREVTRLHIREAIFKRPGVFIDDVLASFRRSINGNHHHQRNEAHGRSEENGPLPRICTGHGALCNQG